MFVCHLCAVEVEILIHLDFVFLHEVLEIGRLSPKTSYEGVLNGMCG